MSQPSGSEFQIAQSVHLDLDGAWPREALPGVPHVDCRQWGPALRYSATRRGVAEFHEFARAHRAKFRLFGSGDYHHLSALWVRELEEPFVLVSFDNHPDWDIRPPHWCCGTWISRALELPTLRRAAVWGCGNFEFHPPNSWFANHRGLRSGRLTVRPWSERLNPAAQKRWPGMLRENWRASFSDFAQGLAGERVYVTVDLDCLRSEEAATNWENGLFTAEDVAWALDEIARHGAIAGGDVCGAYSVPQYARWKQRIESTLDHPKHPPIDMEEARNRNVRALAVIWRSLTAGGDQHHSGADQQHADPEAQRRLLFQKDGRG